MITRRSSVICLIVAAATTAAMTALLFSADFVSRDGAQYFSIADNLLNGHGNATSIVFYEKHYHSGEVPAPQVTFPPGYPIAIAGLASLGLPLDWSALAVSLLCFMCMPLLLAGLMRRAGISDAVCTAAGLAWLFMGINHYMVLHIVSEILFVTLTLASALVYVTAIETHERQRKLVLLIGAGTLAASSFMVRYAGLFYIFALGGLWIFDWIKRPSRQTVVDGTALFLLPALVVGAVFLGNYLLVGDYFGTARIAATHSPELVFRQFLWSFASIAGVSRTGLAIGSIPDWLAGALILAAAATLVFVRRQLSMARPLLPTIMHSRSAQLALMYVAISVVFLAYLGSTSFGGASARYLVPLLPFSLVLFGAAVNAVCPRPDASQLARFGPAALLAAAFLAGQVNVFRDYWIELAANSPNAVIREAFEQASEDATLRRTLVASAHNMQPLLSNEPQLLYLKIRQPTLGLTPAIYSPRTWDEANVYKLVCQYNVRSVLFFPTLLNPAGRDRSSYVLFHELAAGQTPAWLEEVYSSPLLLIYRVSSKESDTANPPCPATEAGLS